MNKVFLIIAMLTLFSLSLFGKTEDFSKLNTQIGLDLPSIAKVYHNKDGEIVSFLGINFIGFGISYKKFFRPLKPNKINPYLNVGTIIITAPYAQVGADYVKDNGFYFGGNYSIYYFKNKKKWESFFPSFELGIIFK
jgi:hypothetical protein